MVDLHIDTAPMKQQTHLVLALPRKTRTCDRSSRVPHPRRPFSPDVSSRHYRTASPAGNTRSRGAHCRRHARPWRPPPTLLVKQKPRASRWTRSCWSASRNGPRRHPPRCRSCTHRQISDGCTDRRSRLAACRRCCPSRTTRVPSRPRSPARYVVSCLLWRGNRAGGADRMLDDCSRDRT